MKIELKAGAKLTNEQAKQVILTALEHLADWPLPSAEAFRNGLLGNAMVAVNPMLGIDSDDELKFMIKCLQDVIKDGHMIDFGFLPNEMIKAESIRSRTMYETGELPHPYKDWLAVSSWEGGFNGYFFSTNPDDPTRTVCMELYGVRMPPHGDFILIYDIIVVEVKAIGDTVVTPAKLRFSDLSIMKDLDTKKSQELRGANCLDPMVTMLKLLADASIPVIDHPAPVKLNKQRLKQGKPALPGHHVVQTADYVSLFQHTRSVKGKSLGGHHASPVAHSRRGHLRHLANGHIVHVRSSRVNWRDQEEMHRLFYRVPK